MGGVARPDSAAGTPVAIALGSNVGDRRAHLAFAVARLRDILTDVRVSPWRETAFVPADPSGRIAAPAARPVLNGVVTGRTRLTARALLDRLLAVERAAGRRRSGPDAPRTLDLDLILYGDAVIREEGLHVPHPRFRERRFVLEPLADLAPAWVDPVTGQAISALLRAAGPS